VDKTLATPLSTLDQPALTRLARLHCAVMHTLLAELGEPIVLRYYQVAQRDPSVLGLCIISPLDQPVAWAIGSPDPGALNARLRQPLPWFAGQILRLALTRPGALLELARSVLSANPANQLQPGQIELTYIGVAASAQGQGLGKSILAAFLQAARQAGHSAVALSVETDNPAALALYTRAGFRLTQTFSEGRFKRQRMEYPLT
jgi:ribosomal protein S18 acetylase RimI-like enzyme